MGNKINLCPSQILFIHICWPDVLKEKRGTGRKKSDVLLQKIKRDELTESCDSIMFIQNVVLVFKFYQTYPRGIRGNWLERKFFVQESMNSDVPSRRRSKGGTY
jgi:hypothetical protein